MNFQDTTATKKIFSLRKRLRFVCGGTSASKTISILIWCIDRAYAYPPANNGETELISVVSESFPHLRLGAITDFENIMKARGYWKDNNWNKTTFTYTFETGSKLEFFSTDSGKAHGPRRDILFVNECNHVDYGTFDQLRVRTKKIIWCDWNPSNEFWYYTEIKDKVDHEFITLTYKDNEALDYNIVQDIESHMSNKNWWAVYGLGQLGEVEGKIYKDWQIIGEIPHEARLERYGLDFGYSNDPTAIIAIYYYNGGYILDEVAYQKGLSNKSIADILNNQPKAMVIADSAEPKSIEEVKQYGVNIFPCVKGPGSVNYGIDYVQQQRISVTNRSINTIKAYRNYMWVTDKNGVIQNTPDDTVHEWSNSMDAVRYGFDSLRPKKDVKVPRYKPINLMV